MTATDVARHGAGDVHINVPSRRRQWESRVLDGARRRPVTASRARLCQGTQRSTSLSRRTGHQRTRSRTILRAARDAPTPNQAGPAVQLAAVVDVTVRVADSSTTTRRVRDEHLWQRRASRETARPRVRHPWLCRLCAHGTRGPTRSDNALGHDSSTSSARLHCHIRRSMWWHSWGRPQRTHSGSTRRAALHRHPQSARGRKVITSWPTSTTCCVWTIATADSDTNKH